MNIHAGGIIPSGIDQRVMKSRTLLCPSAPGHVSALRRVPLFVVIFRVYFGSQIDGEVLPAVFPLAGIISLIGNEYFLAQLFQNF